jgi:outer membrane protein TolC
MKVYFLIFYQIAAGFLILFLTEINCYSQQLSDSASRALTLNQCIEYALKNGPALKQAEINESIGERQIRIGLAGWLPQVTGQFNYTHFFKLQTTAFGNQVINIGRKNTSNIFVEATQTIFNNEVFLATRAAKYSRRQYEQNTQAVKIDVVVDVSKAFYDILLSLEQIKIINDNILRQEKQYKDAYHRYEFGLNDKTDYQRAKITLANSHTDKKRAVESLNAKYAFLKQVIGYPADSTIGVIFDINTMEKETNTDTLQPLEYNRRIEFQQLETERSLLRLNTAFYKYGFLPDVSAFINYNNLYFSNSIGELYNRVYPYSAGGIRLNLQIFQGMKRLNNMRIALYRERQAEIQSENLRNIINTEYQTALAGYKSNYKEWMTEKENVETAREVYGVIKLQYDEGIRAFLDLIVAENDLRASQINYYNALYRLLSARLDLERAIGKINVQ